MSEQSNMAEATATPAAETAAQQTTLNTESTSTETGNNTQALVDNARKKVFGRTNQVRQEEALRAAEFAQMKKPENIALEDMNDFDLPEGKGVDYKSVVEALPDDAKTLIGNLRADYTRKTQELAQQRKQLEAEMSALTNSEFYKRNAELAASEDVQLDPYDTESFEAKIQQEVARRLQDMFEPVKQQQEMEMKKMKLEQFKAEHPDLQELKGDVAKLLQGNHALSLQEAYFIAKGQRDSTRLRELEEENRARRAQMQEFGLKIGTPRDARPNRPPKGLKGFELYQWFERNGKK